MSPAPPTEFDVVIPTVGRPSLSDLLDDLACSVACSGARPGRVIVVDDRPEPGDSPIEPPATLADTTVVVASGGGGPAHARNTGIQLARAPWLVFLDDDVRLPATWVRDLVDDLRSCGPRDAAVQGRLSVPLPTDRRPTDWERNVSGLEGARYITADLAVRTDLIRVCKGFDERFRRAYREDVELAVRILRSGHRIVWGARRVEHPVRPAPWWVSVAKQSGNGDDVLMTTLHGSQWRDMVGAPRGDRPKHVVTAALATAALAAALTRRRLAWRVFGATCLGAVARLTWRRIAPGPRTMREVLAMGATSVVLPFAATFHWVAGRIRWRHAEAKPLPPAPVVAPRVIEPELVS